METRSARNLHRPSINAKKFFYNGIVSGNDKNQKTISQTYRLILLYYKLHFIILKSASYEINFFYKILLIKRINIYRFNTYI